MPKMATVKSSESTSLLASQQPQDLSTSQASLFLSSTSAKRLARSLGFWQAFAYLVGILFGSGVFISPSLVARETATMGMALLVWIVSGTFCIFCALCFCELACALGKTGGEFVFIKEAFGEVAAFCTLWIRVSLSVPTYLSVVGLTIGEFLVAPFYDVTSSDGTWMVKGVAVAAIVISAIINIFSASFVGKSQVFFTAIQSISVLFFIALGIWKVSTGHTQNYVSMFDGFDKVDAGSLSIAFYNGLWAYDGWGLVCTITEELKNPNRNLRLALLSGVTFVIVCFAFVNLSLFAVLTHSEIAGSSTVLTLFVTKIFGKNVALIVPLAAAFSCFSAINGTFFIYSRIILSASREGHLPELLSYIHSDRRTPLPAVLSLLFLSVIYILLVGAKTQQFVIIFSFGMWLTYALAILSVIVLRVRQPDLPRPFKVWIANPIVMTLLSLYLLITPFIKKPVENTICIVVVLAAIPVYFALVKDHDCTPEWLCRSKRKFYTWVLTRSNLVKCVYVANEKNERNSQTESTNL